MQMTKNLTMTFTNLESKNHAEIRILKGQKPRETTKNAEIRCFWIFEKCSLAPSRDLGLEKYVEFRGSKTCRTVIKSEKLLTLWNGAPRNFISIGHIHARNFHIHGFKWIWVILYDIIYKVSSVPTQQG